MTRDTPAHDGEHHSMVWYKPPMVCGTQNKPLPLVCVPLVCGTQNNITRMKNLEISFIFKQIQKAPGILRKNRTGGCDFL